MQPLPHSSDAIPRFVQMLDGSVLDLLLNLFGQPRQFLGSALPHRGDGGGHHLKAKDIGHQFGQAIFGNKLPRLQIDHQRHHTRAALYRCGYLTPDTDNRVPDVR